MTDPPHFPLPVEDDDRTNAAGAERFGEFLTTAAIRGSIELRQHLGLDEEDFLRVAGPSHADVRAFYLYSIADEVTRTGSAMIRWSELAQAHEPPGPNEPAKESRESDAVHRATFGALLTEQALWRRKLLECLVDLICFQTSNSQGYYRHFLLLDELERRLHFAADLSTFYGCASENVEYGTADTRRTIEALERGNEIDFTAAWYRRKPEPIALKTRPPVLSSFRARLRVALPNALPAEKLTLGLTYAGFADASGDIHFTPRETHRELSNAGLRTGVLACGMLSVQVLLRAYQLLGVHAAEGIGVQLQRAFEAGSVGATLLHRFTQPIAAAGDFVVAHGALAEVLAIATSEFGYCTHRIEYLADAPIAEITSEWVLPQHVRLLFRRDRLVPQIRATLAAAGAHTTPSDEEIARRLRATILDAWRQGLRDAVQG